MRTLLLLALSLSTLFAQVPDPKAFREAAMQNGQLQKWDGEAWCWHASGAAADLVQGYMATNDPRWLDESITYFDYLESKLQKDPDGYEGWIGKTIWDSKGEKPPGGAPSWEGIKADTKVGDAILLQPMVQFAEIVLKNPELKAKYGAKAQHYVDLATRIAWESWNKRGAYYKDAAGFGSYHINPHLIDSTTNKWVDTKQYVNPHSENLNKHSAMAIVILRLYRITGKPEYRERAFEVFARLKNLFRYYPAEDRVVWNFWMPHGPYDIVEDKKNGGEKLSSWVAVHPKNAHYQATEVARMVEAYDSGIVFDKDDLQRLIKTNHYMNEGGKWRAADGASPAGALWGSLARFDDKIRTELQTNLDKNKSGAAAIDKAYLDNFTMKHLGWDRLYVTDPKNVTVYEHKPQPGVGLTATVVIPNKIDAGKGEVAKLVTQGRVDGEVKIELLDASGKDVLGDITTVKAYKDGRVLLPAWDGTNPKTKSKDAGEYTVRWTLGDEVRTEKVWVTKG